MCGIAGFLARGRRSQAEQRATVEAMIGLVGHRGPDDSGIESRGPVAFGHRRLSILDLSCAGHQPMTSHRGNLLLSYNGEVYNFQALAAELSGLGATFASHSDTEVILEAIAQWGSRAYERFDGMFAIALWDEGRGELTLTRDRAGIKPLYYWTGEQGVLFSSEVKSIWQALHRVADRRIDTQALTDVVLTGAVYGAQTMLHGVRALRPGESLTFSADGATVRSGYFHRIIDDVSEARYAELAGLPDGQLEDRLDGLLKTSVELHLTSDAPVGVLCSGGVDSSLLTAMSVQSRPDLAVYHATFDGPGNEQRYAEMVTQRLGTKLRLANMTREFYLDHMVRAVWHMDVPSYHANDISLYSVCKLAHDDGCKVLISGEGADELFGGYSWHLGQVRALRMARRLAVLRRINARLGALAHRAADTLASGFAAGPERLWLFGAPVQSTRAIARAVEGASAGGARWSDWHAALGAYSFVKDPDEAAVLAQMLGNVSGHLDTILWRTDRLGMMASIENRVPILENEVIRMGVNLPLRAKIRRDVTKWLLKRVAGRYLPSQVITRPKAGFPVPWVGYLGRDMRALWRDGFVSDQFGMTPDALESWIDADHALRWRLLNLEIWGRLFVRSNPVDEVAAWFARETAPAREGRGR